MLKSNEVMNVLRKGFARIHSKSSVVRLVEGLIGRFLDVNKHVLSNYLGKLGGTPSGHNPLLVQHPRDRINPKCTSQNLPYLYPSPLI